MITSLEIIIKRDMEFISDQYILNIFSSNFIIGKYISQTNINFCYELILSIEYLQ